MCTFIHTHSILIRRRASWDSQSHLSVLGRKAGEVSRCFLCRLMLDSFQLNPSCRCDVQTPRKQLAHNHSALCFHDCSQAHTVYVSGAYVKPSTMAEAGPIISFSHCLFYDRKGIEGLMCSLLASFPAHAPVHKFIG